MNTEHFKAYDSFRYANGMRARVRANNFVRFGIYEQGKKLQEMCNMILTW